MPESLFLLFAVPLVLGAVAVAAIRMPQGTEGQDIRQQAAVEAGAAR